MLTTASSVGSPARPLSWPKYVWVLLVPGMVPDVMMMPDPMPSGARLPSYRPVALAAALRVTEFGSITMPEMSVPAALASMALTKAVWFVVCVNVVIAHSPDSRQPHQRGGHGFSVSRGVFRVDSATSVPIS